MRLVFFPFRASSGSLAFAFLLDGLCQFFPKLLGKTDVFHFCGFGKQRGDVVGGEAGDAATDWCDEEMKGGVRPGIIYELVHIGTDGFHTALHGRYGVALSLQTNPLSHDCTEVEAGHTGGSTAVHALKVAAEDKNFVVLEMVNPRWCDAMLFHKYRCDV